MSEGIPYADIIILALVAGFILLRLRSILGQNDGIDFSNSPPKEKPSKETTIVQLLDKAVKPKPKEEEADTMLSTITDSVVSDALKKIKEKDTQFSASEFISGARRAFEMVFDAFVKGDKETLKMLLSDALYSHFSGEIDAHKSDSEKTETTLVSILTSDIQQAELSGTMARIVVKFTSEQVTVVRNDKQEIIGGDASMLQHIEDEWVFERDVSSKSPNWKIIET